MTGLATEIAKPDDIGLSTTATGLSRRSGAVGLASAALDYPAVELSIVIPTFNERENVAGLVARLERILAHLRWEVIFVDDDSPDGTSDLVRELAQFKR